MNVFLKIICIFFVWLSVSENLYSQKVWRETTYEDFVDGHFDDAGANMYVSHKGNIQMINHWDVNADGNIDILCANSHPLVEMLDMSIYWGNGSDFSIKNHSYIPANGPMWVTPGDLNNDGYLDLVVANYSNGTWTDMDSFIYYGGPKKENADDDSTSFDFFPFNKRISLPGSNAQKAVIGDFNKDGYKDIVFAFSGGFWEYRDKDKEGFSPSRIYWGSDNGFNKDNFENIWTAGATDVASADLNRDSWPDLVFANGGSKESFVYYGSVHGYSEVNRTNLPAAKPHAVEIGDINNDGWPDIALANQAGDVSYAYLNDAGTFSADRCYEFQTYWAKDIAIADFNKDGYTDIFFTNHQYSLTGDPKKANRLIDSYLYFGSAEGFSTAKRQSIPTIGAWGTNTADLNNDGWMDLLVCNFQECYSYEVPSFIYWNGPAGFTETNRTPLYEHGAQGNAIADFNGDSNLDILITSMMGNSRGDYDPNYLYLGTDKGNYSVQNRIELPGREAYEQGFADLDDDGQVDVLLLNRGEVTREANELWIYWNDKNTFNPWRISGLPSYGGLGVEIADLDKNGHLDIIISNGKSDVPPGKGEPKPGSFIYWGSDKGYVISERTNLPIVLTRAVSVCDMNQDGILDLVFGQQGKWGDASIFYGDGTRNFSDDRRVRIEKSSGTGTPGVADLNKDGRLDIAFAHDKNVLIYYQNEDGSFDSRAMTVIDVMAKTMCVADVNNDGWLDLVCPFYRGEGIRSWYSTILLGSKEGYRLDHSIKLPTDGGTGSIVSDFNRDGYPDVFFFCHRADGSYDKIGKFGDHHTNSLLYWGGPDGFNPKKRLEIPSVGAHYDVGIDIGNIRDRSFTFVYTSSAYNMEDGEPAIINWTARIPKGTSIKFQLRSAETEAGLQNAEWFGSDGKNGFFTESGTAVNIPVGGKWLQYRAYFDTGNGANSPILEEVSIVFEK